MGLFDDVKSLVINNNEVKSIVLADGGILYQVSGGSNSYNLVLSSNKNSVNYGVSDTVNLTATLTGNGSPVSDEWVSFYIGNPTVMDSLTQSNNKIIALSDPSCPITFSDEGVQLEDSAYIYYDELLDFVNDSFVIEFDGKLNQGSSDYFHSQFGFNSRYTNYYTGMFVDTTGYYSFFEEDGTTSPSNFGDIIHIRVEISNGEQKAYINNALVTTSHKTFTEDFNDGTTYSSNNYIQFWTYNDVETVKNLVITTNGDGIIIGSARTNNNGVATLSYTSTSIVNPVIHASACGVSDSVSLGLTHDYSLDLVTDDDTLNHSNNESTTLTATLTDNNVPVEGENVLFYEGTVYSNFLTDSNNDFTTLYGDGFTVNNGVVVDYGDRIVHNQLLDMTTNSYTIMFKCRPSQNSQYAVCGNFTTNTGSEQYYTNFNIRNDGYINFFYGDFTLPSGLWGTTLNIKLNITPSQQELYVNNILVGTTTIDLTQNCNPNNNYMNLFLFGQNDEFTIKDLGIIVNGNGKIHGFGVTDSNGEASCTYVSEEAGTNTVVAECKGETDSVTITVS